MKKVAILLSLLLIVSTFAMVGTARTTESNDNWYYMYNEGNLPVDSAIGLDNTATWYSAMNITLPAGEVTEISYYDADSTHYVKGQIYTEQDGELLGETEEYNTADEWKWVDLSLKEPIEIDGGNYWVQLEIYDLGSGTHPVGYVDDYNEDAGWISQGYGWTTLVEYGFDASWAMEVYVEPSPEPDYIEIEPQNYTALCNESVEYTATAYDAYGYSLGEITSEVDWSIEGNHSGFWDGNTYVATEPGNLTVNAVFEYNGEYYNTSTSLQIVTIDIYDLREEIRDLEDNITALENRLDTVENDLDELKGKVTTLQSSLQELDDKVDKIESSVSDLQTTVDNLDQRIDELQTTVYNLVQRIVELQTRISDLENRVDELENETEDNQADISELEDEVKFARNVGILGVVIGITGIVVGVVVWLKD